MPLGTAGPLSPAHVHPLTRPPRPAKNEKQTATVLTLESVQEMLDYWGEGGGGAWRLTENDVRAVLAQRVDFGQQEILALKLS